MAGRDGVHGKPVQAITIAAAGRRCRQYAGPYDPRGVTVSLTSGNRLGPYEIVAPLGAGGMGEVYRAVDTRLKRQVAIKVLPASVAADPERLARFQREAEVLASLSHPHIAAIDGLEDADGVRAIVMELVDGDDLSARIGKGRCRSTRRSTSRSRSPARSRRHTTRGSCIAI